jgi:hypothetical protein
MRSQLIPVRAQGSVVLFRCFALLHQSEARNASSIFIGFLFFYVHVTPIPYVTSLQPRTERYETFPFLCEKRTWRPITTKAPFPNSILSRSLFLYTSCFTRYHLSSVICFPQANSPTLLLTDGRGRERFRGTRRTQLRPTNHSNFRFWVREVLSLQGLRHCSESRFTCCLQNVVHNIWRTGDGVVGKSRK